MQNDYKQTNKQEASLRLGKGHEVSLVLHPKRSKVGEGKKK